VANDRSIERVLVTGAGASCGLGASGIKVAAMKEWADHLTGALTSRASGTALLVGLQYGMDGTEFERRLGKFLASARSFSDARDLMLASSNITYPAPLSNLMTRPNVEEWHRLVSFQIEQVFEVVHETLYTLFGNPSFDLNRARTSYDELLSQIGMGPGAANWVYATTNYDSIGDEALEASGFRIAWGERHRVRAGEPLIDPKTLLEGVRTTVPILHLHGRIGWYRRRATEGGEAVAVNTTGYQPGFGTPIVMLPDPNKVYDSDPVINSIWGQFEQALSRTKRVLVLGHSLNDDQIVSAIARFADPASVAITVYGHSSDPEKPNWNEDPILRIREERLPGSTLIPIRFGEEGVPRSRRLVEWFQRSAVPR
jgi:hypothetical protein